MEHVGIHISLTCKALKGGCNGKCSKSSEEGVVYKKIWKNPKIRERFIQMLVLGYSPKRIAKELNVSKKTVYNWIKKRFDQLFSEKERIVLMKYWVVMLFEGMMEIIRKATLEFNHAYVDLANKRALRGENPKKAKEMYRITTNAFLDMAIKLMNIYDRFGYWMERCGLIPTSEEMREIYKEGRPTPLTMEEILLKIKEAMEEEKSKN